MYTVFIVDCRGNNTCQSSNPSPAFPLYIKLGWSNGLLSTDGLSHTSFSHISNLKPCFLFFFASLFCWLQNYKRSMFHVLCSCRCPTLFLSLSYFVPLAVLLCSCRCPTLFLSLSYFVPIALLLCSCRCPTLFLALSYFVQCMFLVYYKTSNFCLLHTTSMHNSTLLTS